MRVETTRRRRPAGKPTSACLGLVLIAATGSPAAHQGRPDGLAVAVHARAVQPGELTLLAISAPPETTSVRADGLKEHWPVFRDRDGSWQVLVGIDLDTKPGDYSVEVEADTPGGALTTTVELHVAPKAFPTRRLQLDEAFVNPPPEAMAQIEQDAKDLQAIFRTPAPERLWDRPFVRPVPQPANSRFGTRSILNGQPRGAHSGADFLSPTGTAIASPNAGRVRLARSLYYSGNTVIIDHGLGVFSMVAHLSVIGVHDGQSLAPGDIVGKVGATGRVTGPHLHWAVRIGDARVDPLSLLALLGTQP